MKSLEDVINSYCTRDGSLSNQSKTCSINVIFLLMVTYMGWEVKHAVLWDCNNVLMLCLYQSVWLGSQRSYVFMIIYRMQMKHIVSSLQMQTQHYEDIYHFIEEFVPRKISHRYWKQSKACPDLMHVLFKSVQLKDAHYYFRSPENSQVLHFFSCSCTWMSDMVYILHQEAAQGCLPFT